MTPDAKENTQILQRAAQGDKAAVDLLFPMVYDKLRELAANYVKWEKPGQTLQPTDLVHEAYACLVDYKNADWKGRTHFFATAAKVMSQILIDHARRRRAQKRGGSSVRVTLSGIAGEIEDVALFDLTEAMDELAGLKPRHHEVICLRFFGGLKVREIAEIMGHTTRTVERDTRMAIAWLQARLKGGI